jgi:hypothetical protein
MLTSRSCRFSLRGGRAEDVGAKLVTRNAGQRLDSGHPLNRNPLPLRHGLRGQVAQRARQLRRAARILDDFFANLFHARIESISYQGAQVLLSMKFALSSDIAAQ